MNGTIPTMLTLRETSQRTGLSYEYLRQLCIEDRIVFIRAGKKYLINMDRLIEYLNNGGMLNEE